MILALAALALTILTLLWAMDRQGKRHHEENQAHRLQVAGLLQRIQAPELAVAQHGISDARDLPAVNPFDSADYWEAKDEEQQALARIAELEREMN